MFDIRLGDFLWHLMRLALPPDQLDIQSRFRAVPHDGRKFLRSANAGNFRPRHLVQFYRDDG